MADPTLTAGTMSSLPGRLSGARGLCRLISFSAIPKTVLSLFDQALISGTSFLTTVLIGRASSPAELGLYALAMSLILFGRGFQEQLIAAPYMIRVQHQRPGDLAAFTGSNLLFELVLIVVATIVLVGYGLLRELGMGASHLDRVLLVLGGVLPCLLMRDYLRHVSLARFNFRSLLLLDGIASLLQIAGLFVLWQQKELRASTALLVMGGANGLVVLLWFLMRSEPLRFVQRRLVSDWRELWAFGKWALASFMVNCATPLIMPWVMALAINPEAAGLLAACTSLVGLANTFAMGVCNYLSPKAAKAFATGGIPALNRVLRETALLFTVTLGALVFVMLLAGNQIAAMVYGHSYGGTGPILFLLSLGVLLNSLGIVFGNGLWAVHRPAANFRADACSLLAAVITTILCVPVWGVVGAAWASVIAPATGGLVRWQSYCTVTRQIEAASGSADGQHPAHGMEEA